MPTSNCVIDRRGLLKAATMLVPGLALARPAAAGAGAGRGFDFEALTEEMRRRAETAYQAPAPLEGPLAELTYDLYRLISFDPDRARLAEGGSDFRLHAFHPGWLFKEPVALHEVVDGTARPMAFAPGDFRYYNEAETFAGTIDGLPGISGFRLHFR